MTHPCLLHSFLGLQVLPLLDGIFISQSKYVLKLLKRFSMVDRKSCATPFQTSVKLTKGCPSLKFDATLYQQLVGNRIYLTHICLEFFNVSVISWFMKNLRESHWNVSKRVVCYLKGTSQFGRILSKIRFVGKLH